MMTVEQCHKREEIRLAVHSALRHRFPDLVLQSFESWGQPGALQMIHDHLDLFIQILEESPHITLDSYREQIRQRLCPGCFEQLPTGFCALRATGQCAVKRCTPVIYETICYELGQA
jgi:hypothetical protein